MALNLITTKLMVPRPPQSVVERPHLVEQLQGGLRTKLILVSAPAGSGKSTLLASWLRILDRPTAWLSLDAGDNDLERFLLYVVSALQQVDPGLGKGLTEVLQTSSSVDIEALISRIINDVARWGQELLLVLDDYHVVSNPNIHQAVEFFLEHIPPGLCLVMATRTDPPLALSRLRVRRQMVELRGEQLRFSVEETAAFLNQLMDLGLSPQAIYNLEEHTEGWVAGLQLAAISLEGRSDKESFVEKFAGSHRYLVEYLVDEVLERQTAEVQQFLHRTSILERFTAGLCEAVSGQGGAQKRLEQLDSANLFLIPLDDERRWYRYHHLFAEFLQHRLRATQALQIPELHRRASEWFEREGWTDEAIQHALAAQDFQRAGRLVETIGIRLWYAWNNAQLIKYVERLPLELLPDFPWLCIYYGWALVNTGGVEALAALISVIERHNSRTQPSRAIAVALRDFRAVQFSRRLEFSRAIALCREALELLGSEETSSDEEGWLRATTTNLLSYFYILSDIPKADQFLAIAFGVGKGFTGIGIGVYRYTRHGRIKHQLGNLKQAMELFGEGLAAIERRKSMPGAPAYNEGDLRVSLAHLLYEWDRLDEVEAHLQKASEFNQRSQTPPVMALELETTAWLHLARGEFKAPLEGLSKLDRMLAEAHPSNLLHRMLFGVMGMNLRLRLFETAPGLGNLLDEVGRWLEAGGMAPEDEFTYFFEASYFVLARYLVARGQVGQALPVLDRLIQAAGSEGRKSDWLRYCILKSLAAHREGQESLALQTLQATLVLAEAEGYCRSFVDQGVAMQLLLQKLSISPYAQKLLSAYPPPGIEVVEAEATSSQPPSPPPPNPMGSLSARELEILRLLAGGNSNKEIGRVLNLSSETVKWYIKGLYEKLEVNGRQGAVNRAIELGLL